MTDTLRPIDAWYLSREEPSRSCLQFLRAHILQFDKRITEAWKYSMPFFCVNDKMFCYLWFHRKLQQPYLGIVEGSAVESPELLQEKRARMKILLIDPNIDIPLKKIDGILQQLLTHYIR